MRAEPQPFIRGEKSGPIAVLVFDRPPVNAINVDVRRALLDLVISANADPSIHAILLIGAGGVFSAGSDIREFDHPQASPTSVELFRALANSPKPIVAAIEGVAFGGGLEMALACHYRVATTTAQFALPEITLGLIPGGGGTQRLPRLIGFATAIPMIFGGKPIGATEALTTGLVDRLYADDLRARGVEFAGQIVDGTATRAAAANTDAEAAAGDLEIDASIEKWRSRSRSPAAAESAAKALRAARDLPLEDGLALERRLFMTLRDGDESKAHRYIFFAERSAMKRLNVGNAKILPVSHGAIVGAGTMGTGIALAMAGARMRVVLIDKSSKALDRAAKTVANTLARMVSGGTMDKATAADYRDRISMSQSLSAAGEADVIVEAVYEDFALKKEILRAIDFVARPDAMLATNTSTLDVNEIAAATARPHDVVGLHFFSPAHVMPLLEVVRGSKTSQATVQRAIAFGKALGKKPVVVGVCDGFVGNRMHLRRSANVERLLQEGVMPEDIDRVAVSFGFAMGPCATSDLTGLDVAWRIRQAKAVAYPVADALCERNRLGQKTGAGYYRYEEGSRVPIVDPEVKQIIHEIAASRGHRPQPIADAEILDRLLLPIINEGAHILEEGIAWSASDIDVIWANGYGWPTWRGGPMYYADWVGLPTIHERLGHYEKQLSDATLEPASLIELLAKTNRSFHSLA